MVHNSAMETKRDLTRASREELLRIIAEQEATITRLETVVAQLQQRVDALETRLCSRGSSGMPGTKPPTPRKAPRKEARQRRPHGFARTRMPPTRTVQHAIERGPDCGTHLVGGWVQRTRQVIELPVVPVEVIEHQFIARECPLCRKRHVPKARLHDVAVGKQRLGIGLVSRIVTLREVGRLPFATIQWYLETFHQLHLRIGGLVGVVHQAAKLAEPAVAQVREQIRASPVVHADETGWRQERPETPGRRQREEGFSPEPSRRRIRTPSRPSLTVRPGFSTMRSSTDRAGKVDGVPAIPRSESEEKRTAGAQRRCGQKSTSPGGRHRSGMRAPRSHLQSGHAAVGGPG